MDEADEVPRFPRSRAARVLIPLGLGVLFLAFWEFAVREFGVSKFVLPPPSSIVAALIDDFPSLLQSLLKSAQLLCRDLMRLLVKAARQVQQQQEDVGLWSPDRPVQLQLGCLSDAHLRTGGPVVLHGADVGEALE